MEHDGSQHPGPRSAGRDRQGSRHRCNRRIGVDWKRGGTRAPGRPHCCGRARTCHARPSSCLCCSFRHLGPRCIVGGRSRVGCRAFLGLGAIILPGITVGDDAVVGAGSVVTHDVSPGATVAGVPARVLKR
ncbi:MAG: hypothetical protein E6H74_15400 [Betaproteobacteria bacterium]|nr:MAG: hypothetical protein E6H74_15400 [Betaproteobacteria bacterium]